MATLPERIDNLCAQHGISGYKLCKDIGISPNTLTELRKGRKKGMSASSANKIADYFKVTVAYLLGESNNPTSEEKPATESGSELDATTKELLNLAATLDPADVHMLLDMAKAIKARRKDDEK